MENSIFPFRCQSIWIQFCGKFKPHVSDSFTLNPWEGCVATAIACPEHLSLLVNRSWGQRDGERRDEETSLGRPREHALWAQDSGPGAGLCCGMCGQLLFHTPSAGVGQDGCSIDKIHFSTSRTLAFLSLSPTNWLHTTLWDFCVSIPAETLSIFSISQTLSDADKEEGESPAQHCWEILSGWGTWKKQPCLSLLWVLQSELM